MKIFMVLSVLAVVILAASSQQVKPPGEKDDNPLPAPPGEEEIDEANKAQESETESQNEDGEEPAENEENDETEEEAEVVQKPRNSAEKIAEQQAEEHSDLFEGDIKLTPKQKKALKAAMSANKKEAITGALGQGVGVKWPGGKIPYQLATNFDASRKKTLEKAIKEYNDKTCIKFVPKKSSDKAYIKFIIDDRKCYSYIGKSFPGQPISIGNGCNYVGTFIHEMMHAVGFFHEQSRLDRDTYVEIIEDNIDTWTYGKDVKSNFAMYKRGQAETLGEDYDLDSIMHYPKTAFGKRDSRGGYMTTIRVKNNPNKAIGQRDTFSEGDIKQINMMYNCKDFL